jgi:hypothetical protein
MRYTDITRVRTVYGRFLWVPTDKLEDKRSGRLLPICTGDGQARWDTPAGANGQNMLHPDNVAEVRQRRILEPPVASKEVQPRMTKAFFFDIESGIAKATIAVSMIGDSIVYRLTGRRYYVVFQHRPVIDPMFEDDDLSEEEVERLWSAHEDFMMVVRGAVAASELDVLSAYYLMKDCLAAGYDEQKHGTYTMCWIVHTVASAIEEWEKAQGVSLNSTDSLESSQPEISSMQIV